jgi:PDZ domain-containing protein
VRRLLTPGRLVGLGLVLLVVAGFVLWLAPSDRYVLLPDKARPVAPLVTVKNGRAERAHDSGQISFLAVKVRKASLLEWLFPWLRQGGATVVPASALVTPGVSQRAQDQIDERDMTESQQIAGAVALRALGYHVVTKESGAEVAALIDGMPAVGKLRPTDVITAVDGTPVSSPSQLRARMRGVHPGQTVRLTVRSTNGLRTVSLATVPDPHDRSRPLVGVIVDQAADVHLPFPVTIDPGNVVGPSAGLAFALEIMEKLGRNVDRGYRIAATGELELNGDVLPIGGVKQKAVEAHASHVDILLVPAGENAQQARRYAGNVRVIPVKNFQQALRTLATLPERA